MLVGYCICSSFSGKGQISGNAAFESKRIELSVPVSFQAQRDYDGFQNHQPKYTPNVCKVLDLALCDWVQYLLVT